MKRIKGVKVSGFCTIMVVLIVPFLFLSCADAQTAEEYLSKGKDKADLGDFKGAIKDYNKAIELNPNYAEAYLSRGLVKSTLVDYTGAIQDFDKAIEINPSDAISYAARGFAKVFSGDSKGGIQDCNKAIEINPKKVEGPYLARGMAKANLEDYQGAIQDFNEVIEINPELALAYYGRGIAKIGLGQKDSACLDLSKAGAKGYSAEPNFKAAYEFSCGSQ